MEEKRRAQRDRVLRHRRGITEEQKPLFALGRKDSKIPDMDNDASEMASKRQNLEKTRRFKRHAILTEKRKMENLMKSRSTNAELQRTVLATMRKIGELVRDRRRINKNTILKKQRNIISSELEMEEVLQETPRHVSVSSSETEETLNLQREAAQQRIKNNRDWVVQCRRRLFYAKPIVNGNGALRRSKSPAVCISSRKSEKYTGIVSAANTSLEKDAAADGSLSLGHASSRTSSPRQMVNIVYSIDIENLQFHKMLGEGQYGKVILASDPVSEELLAVKIMAKSHIQDKIFTELEVLTIAEGCRFLICMRASMETPEEHIIAMDFMAGGDLRDLTEWLPFDIDTTRLFAAEMVCGLQYLHENGVIHRDLKPENVLLDATGHIKIADFGVSSINVFEEDTVTGLVGSLGYIAPEVLSGEEYNHLVDSFSFGVILYLMTVGFEPFYGQGSVEDYYLSLEEDEPEFPPEMCPDTINFIEGLFCKTPCERLPITLAIRIHPFFHPINWDDVESGIAPPPFQLDFE